MVRERGSGKTPQRVVELLSAAVKEKSILAVHKATGIGLAAIGRYLKGVGEPTTATLQKLADYFGVDIHELRNNQDCILDFSSGDQVSIPYNSLMLNAVEMALLFDINTTQAEFNSVLTSIITRYLRGLPGEPVTFGQEKILALFEQYRRDTGIISG